MLMDGDSALAQRRAYTRVHAHELAHQWFGDSLTPRAWADIWLNEGFATYSEALWYEADEGTAALIHRSNSVLDDDSQFDDRLDDQRLFELIRSVDGVEFDNSYDFGQPLTLVAGIFGMNFEYMPELSYRYGYFMVLGGMALLAVILLLIFRIKRWI